MQSWFARLQRRFRHDLAAGRRDFFAQTAAIGASLLLSNQRCNRVHARSTDRQRVVIVGGGLAGLACGHELLAAGYDVQIVEARPRLGGRVLTFHDLIPGRVIEGGAELIGSNHPTWLAYAEKFGLEFLDVSEDEDLSVPIHLGGRLLDDETVERLYQQIDKVLAGLTEQAQAIDPDKPWESPNAGQLDNQSLEAWIAKLDVPPLVRRLLRIEFSSDNGVANSAASLLATLAVIQGGGGERFWSETEVYRCRGGNDQVARRLAATIGPERIRLGDPVKRIRYRGNLATVECQTGARYECDRVVLATPTSTWGSIRLEPDLPDAIKRQQMGVAVKYLTHVRSRYWHDNGLSQFAITDGPISQTWESTDGQTSSDRPQDGEPGFGLTAFSGGPQAEICLGFSRDTRDADYATEFEKVYPGFGDQFLQSRFMDWPRDPHTLAGYSFPALGQITTIGKTFNEGIDRLDFCGEQTCYRFIGYMEGGLYSGATLAKRIARKDGL